MTAALHSSSMSDSTPSSGGTLVSIDGRTLPLRSVQLRGRHRAGLGRVLLEQRFENPYAEPLRVNYQLPLPEDGAVSGFSFVIGDRRVVGEVDEKRRARERFEEAIAQGRSAAHLEQERGSVFTQEVGNIPPGTSVVVSIEIDQRLVWIPDAGRGVGGWEWRFPTVVAPRYMGAPGRVPDASKVAVVAADRPRPIAVSMEMTVADALPEGALPSSPSHALQAGRGGLVRFGEDGVGLDRDVVVRWPVATPTVGLTLDVARPSAGHALDGNLFGLLTVVPPSIRPDAPVSRDLVVLLDTSGSMGGEPLEQAKRVTSALIDGLTERDTLELVEFSSRPRRFAKGPMRADAKARTTALGWVASLRAGGGTEMVSGILAALDQVRAEAQRQVVVITDGLIGFERDVVSAILERLPSGSRLHTVGVGSAVNRSLTGPAARAGRGVEVVVGIGEDPERATARLLERTQDPIVVDLQLEGDALSEHAPMRLPDLYAGSPALISVKLSGAGGTLRVRGRTAAGVWEADVEARTPADGIGNAGVTACFAREKVEDHELARTAGGDAKQADAAITTLGLSFQIATRLTSWVAISDGVDVDPSDPTRREVVPQEIPYGMSVEGLGLRSAAPGVPLGFTPMAPPAPAPASSGVSIRRRGAAPGSASRSKKAKGLIPRLLGGISRSRDDEFEADDFADAPEPVEKEEFALAEEVAEGERQRGEAVPALELRGSVLSKTDDTWIVELSPTHALRWSPRGEVLIRLADGTDVAATIVAQGTTREGQVSAHTKIRLVIRLGRVCTLQPRSLSLSNDGHAMVVVF